VAQGSARTNLGVGYIGPKFRSAHLPFLRRKSNTADKSGYSFVDCQS
jgi:hypothetical protein